LKIPAHHYTDFVAVTCVHAAVYVSFIITGHLSADALYFVFDHCFLLGWQQQLPLFCVDIAVLLRSTVMRASTGAVMKSIVSEASTKLYTRDVRTAFAARHITTTTTSAAATTA
jgi:hypothetical protein